MTFSDSGFILYCTRYSECVAFYRDVLNLEVLYTKEQLTCFTFGGSYLMVEIDDEYKGIDAPAVRDRTCLRMNVADVKAATRILEAHQIPFDYLERDWGTVAKFRDPDGNLIGLRSAGGHVADLKG